MIKLDGSYGEGGGQILRNAAAYAAILRKDLGIRNIRAGRSQPGLRRQHITGLQLLVDACGGTVEGLGVGSQEIVFRVPTCGARKSNSSEQSTILTGDTETAGSICLLLQAALPYALVGSDSIQWVLKGGTNASMAPQFDYWELVFLPTLMRQLQLPLETVQPSVVRRGFFPKGGGEVHVSTKSTQGSLPSISLVERGDIAHVLIRSFHAGKCPRRVAERMASTAKDHLEAQGTTNISVSIVYEEPAISSGSGILIIATTITSCRLAGSALGSPKVPPTQVGIEAAKELCATLEDGGCVDEYLQDQLVLYMALAEGTSEMITGSMTLHTRTAIWTAEQCCEARFQVDRLDGGDEEVSADAKGRIAGRHRISCKGIGFSRS
jgi:RNA 3'-terminal phosphate cyclase (ATP)